MYKVRNKAETEQQKEQQKSEKQYHSNRVALALTFGFTGDQAKLDKTMAIRHKNRLPKKRESFFKMPQYLVKPLIFSLS